MSNSQFTLEIISHHPQFANKTLCKHYIDGIDTIGVWGNEPFEIRFKNNTWQKIQVKLSIDGTDIITGKLANTEVSSEMWSVNGYGTLSIKAWPETNNGGAGFVFTNTENGVATHTHGNVSNQGIIAAAVFIEGQSQTINLASSGTTIQNHYHYTYPYYTYPYNGTIWCNTTGNIQNSVSANQSLSDSTLRSRESKELQSMAAVGAGQHVDQQITYVSGLIKPLFTETLRVRYLWWDDLKSKLQNEDQVQPHASGFPGDKQNKNIDLGSTPRIGNNYSNKQVHNFQRV